MTDTEKPNWDDPAVARPNIVSVLTDDGIRLTDACGIQLGGSKSDLLITEEADR